VIVTRDRQGSYIFLRNWASGAAWSADDQVIGVDPEGSLATLRHDPCD
jgi:hypothetical protein